MKAYITKLATAIPAKRVENPPGRLRKKTGIAARHIASDGETAADLAYRAAENLLCTSDCREAIDFLILCTQSPDYFLPPTACILQDRLGLRKSCGAFDFDLGCSGYVYGLGIAKGLIESEQAEHVLLLTSETYSKYIHPEDSATLPLFGDGATATLIEAVDTNSFGIDGIVYGTDGSGAKNLIVPVGGQRHPHATTEVEETRDKYGNVRTNRNLFMSGSGIMNFALDVVPKALEEILSKTHLAREDIDYYVFHQANQFMLRYLQQECNLEGMPYWNNVAEVGNTVSSSIPIALFDLLRNHDGTSLRHVLLMGFGVGLSWGGCVVDLTRMNRK
ncbi:MAG: ketoacyl-ACP synthase III [Selenomonas sp.]|uniref:3-oxoacyl-ACP synthase III family protein n=1 Tax=Selenomonas sp. TaxID=2053611 RepID=UPI0025DBFE0E|nr:ketoacyl-ACP synthase III [Selenomonas sp.]MCI6231640.1 ketoacyl-ACP synthase III [Selenomonas sp.]